MHSITHMGEKKKKKHIEKGDEQASSLKLLKQDAAVMEANNFYA